MLLDKAAGCLAAMARQSNAMVNELMNHVQKQVFFLMAGVGDGGLGRHLAGGHGGGGFGDGVSLQNRYGGSAAPRPLTLVEPDINIDIEFSI